MPRKANTITKLGLRGYLDQFYAPQGGYDRFMKMLAADFKDSEIAAHFTVSRPTVNYWRKVDEAER